MRTPEEIRDEFDSEEYATATATELDNWIKRIQTESFNAGVIVGEEKGLRKAAEICQQQERFCRGEAGLHVHAETGCDKCYREILSAAEKVGKG